MRIGPCEHYPAEQLGKAKDILSLTLSGVADIGYVAPAFVSDKLPLGVVAELPEAFTTACEGTAAYWKIAREGGVLDKAEFGPNGVKALFVLALAPYQLYVTRGEIASVAALSGKKIRTTGGAKELALRKLGAVPRRRGRRRGCSHPASERAQCRPKREGPACALEGVTDARAGRRLVRPPSSVQPGG